ncbi:hypothetical protein C0J52_03012 [Blattella germanica]|nr:hypothetical protein C0J52_03012 [Blattella germanica]
MAEKEIFSKLPKPVQEGAGIQEIESDMDLIEDMLTTRLPQHRRAGVVDEMRKNYLLMKFKTLDLKKRLQKRKKTQLSLKERRELGMYKIYRKGMKYKDFQDLHCLWKQYISNYLDLKELRKRG